MTPDEARALQARMAKLFRRMLRSKSRRRRLMLARAWVRCADRLMEYKREKHGTES